MKVLVTGGRGFLGTRLAAALKNEHAADVHVLSHHAHDGADERVHTGDITKGDDVSRVFDAVRPEWVFHLAADIGHGTDASSYATLFETNVRGTLNVLAASANSGVSAFVSAGSFEEYGNAPTPFREDGEIRPISSYGTTKAMATLLVTAQGKATLPAAALRFPVLYGNGGHKTSFLGRLKEACVSHTEIGIPKERVEREFLHVDDAVRSLVRAAQRIEACRGEVINTCAGKPVALRDVVRLAEEVSDGHVTISDGTARPFEQFAYAGSTEKAKRILDFEPRISLREGLKAFLADRGSVLG